MTGDGVLVNDFVEQEESSIMEHQQKESSKWTNEKHSLYLKSIEASFIDQLYNNSMNMQNCSRQNTSDANLSCIPSGQFKVLQRGSWSKKCFKKENSRAKNLDRPHVSPGNTWIQHFSNGSLKRLSSTSSSQQYPVPVSQSHQELGCSDTEVTDQNFVDETSRSRSRKRTRTSKIRQSGNDQVVPHCTSDATTEIPDSYDCSKK